MSFLRKLARRKAPSGATKSSSAADSAVPTDLSTHGQLSVSPFGEEQRVTTQKEHRTPERSGHRYDGVNTGGQSRNHLGDVYTKNVTYNYGAPRLASGRKEQTSDDDDVQSPAAARLEEERIREREDRSAKEQQRLEFMQALEFDSMDSRLSTISPAHRDTCTWIVEAPEYVSWRDESRRHEHHGVLWIKGKPGSGKSTLMKYALEVAQGRDHDSSIVSFFFNARGQSLEISAEGMYRSLLQQILSQLPHVYSGQSHVKDQVWPIEMLETTLRHFVLSLNANEHIVCYIDALDECTEAEVRDVVGLFEDLVDLTVSQGMNFSICFSSRHYPHITMHKFQELKLDDRDEHLRDISEYVHVNVGRLDIPHSSKNDIEANIKRRSSGVFLWVVLVIKMLRKKRDQGASHSELASSLAAVPDKLGDLFASILENSGEDTVVALLWILYAKEPMQPEQLYFAIKTSTHQLSTGEWDKADVDRVSIERFVMRSTRGLVETFQYHLVVFPEIRLQFIHESVREHLLQSSLASLTMESRLKIGGPAHAQLARWCRSYIQLDSSKIMLPFPYRNWGTTFPFLPVAMENIFHQSELAYGAGTLCIDFLSEISLGLVICCHNILEPYKGLADSTTLLFLLLRYRCYALATALLRACSQTERPGFCTYRTTQGSSIAFDINAYCGEEHGSALETAVEDGQTTLVQLLLHNGAGAEVVTSRRGVPLPLVAAVRRGNTDVAELLIQHGADVNPRMNGDNMPLQEAAYYGNYAMVALLLRNGADANLTGGKYGSSLGAAILGHYRWRKGEHDRVMCLLLDHGAQVNTWQGKSPLSIAAIEENQERHGTREMTDYVLELGAEVDARVCFQYALYSRGRYQQTVLYGVAAYYHGEHTPFSTRVKPRIEALLERGADINAVCEPHGTPLIAATARSNHEIVSFLLDHGADIHHRGRYGTALDVALRKKKNVSIARLLWNAQCAEMEWSRGRFTRHGRVDEHWHDTATIHRIEYHSGCDDNSDDSSDDDGDSTSYGSSVSDGSSDSYASDDSDQSIASAKTI